MKEISNMAKRWGKLVLGSLFPTLMLLSLKLILIEGSIPGELDYGDLPVYGLSLLWFHRAGTFLLTAPIVFLTMPFFSLNNPARRIAAFVITLLALGCYAVSIRAAWSWMVISVEQVHFNAAVTVYPVLSLCCAFSQFLPEPEDKEVIEGDAAEQ